MLRYFYGICLVLLFSACSQPAEGVPNSRSHDHTLLIDKSWEWVGTETPVGKITAAQPEKYTIRFAEAGALQARFDCNRGGGSYTLSDGKIAVGSLRSTKMACRGDSQDRVFMHDLGRVQTFFLEDGNLYLELPFDSGTMVFRPAS